MANVSELRQDLVTGTWAVIATGRVKRPDDFKTKKRTIVENEKDCPFCHPGKDEKRKPTLVYKDLKGEWSLMVTPNKYPAFGPSLQLNHRNQGPFSIMDGAGFHEVIITKDHNRHIAKMKIEEVEEIVGAYQERYLGLMNRRFINYISIFHNHGREAGASLGHPHSQLVAMPVIDPDVWRSLKGSADYWQKNKMCVHCVMIEWEKESAERVIFENEEFIALCPFVSRTAFEVKVYPKFHASHFERINQVSEAKLAQALRAVLIKIDKGLNNPAYNFFLHTAPCDGKDYSHYHWHFEILPKTSIWAGFELGTGIEISTIEPEKAAEFLKQQKV